MSVHVRWADFTPLSTKLITCKVIEVSVTYWFIITIEHLEKFSLHSSIIPNSKHKISSQRLSWSGGGTMHARAPDVTSQYEWPQVDDTGHIVPTHVSAYLLVVRCHCMYYNCADIDVVYFKKWHFNYNVPSTYFIALIPLKSHFSLRFYTLVLRICSMMKQ